MRRETVLDVLKLFGVSVLLLVGVALLQSCGSEPIETTAPTAATEATPTPEPTPVCKPSTVKVWSSQGGYPEPGEVIYTFQDHEWVFLRANVCDVKGDVLDPACEWDRYLGWRNGNGEANCRLYGNDSGNTAAMYCYGIGEASVCADATKDGLHLKECARWFVRSQPAVAKPFVVPAGFREIR